MSRAAPSSFIPTNDALAPPLTTVYASADPSTPACHVVTTLNEDRRRGGRVWISFCSALPNGMEVYSTEYEASEVHASTCHRVQAILRDQRLQQARANSPTSSPLAL